MKQQHGCSLNNESENRFWQLVFALLLALCGVVLFVLIRGESGDYHGQPHPVKTDMLIGGPAVERAGDLIWVGFLFGALQLVFFVALLSVGFQKVTKDLRRTTQGILWGGGILYLALFALVFFQYHREIYAGDQASGLPASTWTAIFLLWPCPYLFVAAYSLGFRRFFYAGSVAPAGRMEV